MAIEIKELVIKMKVESQLPVKNDMVGKISVEDKKLLIKECVSKVMELLETKSDR